MVRAPVDCTAPALPLKETVQGFDRLVIAAHGIVAVRGDVRRQLIEGIAQVFVESEPRCDRRRARLEQPQIGDITFRQARANRCAPLRIVGEPNALRWHSNGI